MNNIIKTMDEEFMNKNNKYNYLLYAQISMSRQNSCANKTTDAFTFEIKHIERIFLRTFCFL